jgi:anthranilate synthase
MATTTTKLNSLTEKDATVQQVDPAQEAPAQPQPDYNSVFVAKTGGQGAVSPADRANPLTLGAPPATRPRGGQYVTKGGIHITANVEGVPFESDRNSLTIPTEGTSAAAIQTLLKELDSKRGVLLASSYEFPGRYARWSLGFVNPPLVIEGSVATSTVTLQALNARGKVLLPAIQQAMQELLQEGMIVDIDTTSSQDEITVKVAPPPEVGTFSEEERSRQPSIFSVVRALVKLFEFQQEGDEVDGGQLGLYGAFGYDLTFQFEAIDLKQKRENDQRDVVLYLPDEILVVDNQRNDAWKLSYDFAVESNTNDSTSTTEGLERAGTDHPFEPFDDATRTDFIERDTPPSEFATSVDAAKKEFAVGNLFEAVLSQTFRHTLSEQQPPSTLFKRLKARNPAPYGFSINLGQQEYLVGASPEMFVRCEPSGDPEFPDSLRIETCPISGTVARGADALEDAKRIKSLISNAKEESELTMCTDVDRNDKSRICVPGSVKVIGRRQIEMYSRLIHTVDHVEGYLRTGFDALDGFLCHTWAVTVTGAPKTWAIQFVEDMERTPRRWYGGAVGLVGFNGSLNTGLTLRTVRIHKGIAEVRAGATLLYDSCPEDEEAETELKASAMIDAIVRGDDGATKNGQNGAALNAQVVDSTNASVGAGKRVVLIDHEDSFVHTLGNYLRQTGATVETLRSGPSALMAIDAMAQKGNKPDMVVLSPGPGNPSDFGVSDEISLLLKHDIPIFGVCLGLQGMVEHFGGTLGILSYPMHGKPSQITLTSAGQGSQSLGEGEGSNSSIFTGLPDTFEVARYHSLHGIRDTIPDCLEITALSEDGIVMAIQHKTLPLAAVQFHPESILTSPAHGMTILMNCLKYLSTTKSN